MDISADLTELGRTPVAVISAGIKSVLDIGRTLEYLVREKRLILKRKAISSYVKEIILSLFLPNTSPLFTWFSLLI